MSTSPFITASLSKRVQFFVPMNEKIADITHADNDKHFLNLAAVLHAPGVAPPETRKIIAVLLKTPRMAGAGNFLYYPNEGLGHVWSDDYRLTDIVIANGSQRVQYALDNAGDDWDMWCLGYVVEA